jgi:hypothetical protein
MIQTDSALRQSAADREYLAACRTAGIEADLPRYDHGQGSGDDARLDTQIQRGHSHLDAPDDGAGFQYFDDPPEGDAVPEEFRSGFTALVRLLLAGGRDVKTTSRAAGHRAVCLGWLLGVGPSAGRSLASIATELSVSRAMLSYYVREIERATGLHARGQKSASAVAVYRQARHEAVASGRGLNLKRRQPEGAPTL